MRKNLGKAVLGLCVAGMLITGCNGKDNNVEKQPSTQESSTTNQDVSESTEAEITSKDTKEDVDYSAEPGGVIPKDCTYYCGSTQKTLKAGEKFPEEISVGDIYTTPEYQYIHMDEYGEYSSDSTQWNVIAISKTKTSYGKILETVMGHPIVLMDGTFKDCTNMVTAPEIPSTVHSMISTFEGCTSLEDIPALPADVTCQNTFNGCISLKPSGKIIGRVPTFEDEAYRIIETKYLGNMYDNLVHWTVIIYDEEGKEIGQEQYTEEGILDSYGKVIYEYDDKGNIVKEQHIEGLGLAKGIEPYEVDENKVYVSSDSYEFLYEYYENGNIKRKSGGGYIEEYDEDGNLVRELSKDTFEVVAEYEYIKNGNVVEVKRSGVLYEKNEYDEVGNLIKCTTYNEEAGKVMEDDIYTYEYDSEGNMTKCYQHNNYNYMITYTRMNIKKSAKEPSDEGVALRVTEKSFDITTHGCMYWKVYKYNSEGKLLGLEKYTKTGELFSWTEFIYECDDKGNIITERIKIYGSDGSLINDSIKNSYIYEYDSDGKIKTKHWVEGFVVYKYDSNGYVVEAVSVAPQVANEGKEYCTYKNDSEGKVIEEARYNNDVVYRNTKYEYEGGNVKKIICDAEGNSISFADYDKYGNQISYDKTYEYNADGDLVKVVDEMGDRYIIYSYEKLQ